jgi:hypothetical protein
VVETVTFPEAVDNLLRPARATGGGRKLSDLLQVPGLDRIRYAGLAETLLHL